MNGRRTMRRTLALLMAMATATAAGSLYAQARRAQRPGEAVIGPFADAHAALAAVTISDDAAVASMLQTLRVGFPTFPATATTLKTDDAARLRFVRAMARVLPRIVESEPFVEAYAQFRTDAITSQLGSAPVDPALSRQDRISTLRQDIEGYRLDLRAPGLSRSQRNRLEDQIETAEDQLRPLEREASNAATRERDQRTLTAAQAEFEQRRAAATTAVDASLPADSRVAVARRLRAFVDGCADVDFRAATTTANGVTRFTSPENEARPRLWKLCFRAGRRTTDEARRLARSWLTTLGRAGVTP